MVWRAERNSVKSALVMVVFAIVLVPIEIENPSNEGLVWCYSINQLEVVLLQPPS